MVKTGEGYDFLKLMKETFNPGKAEDLEAIIEFVFTDLEETHHFEIKEGKCKLRKGESDDFSLKIITEYEDWLKVSKGEVSGPEAMAEGLYEIRGDFDLLKSFDDIFSSGDEEEEEWDEEKKENILVGRRAMSFSFIPWILSWVFIEWNWWLGLVIPLVFSLSFFALKEGKNLETTYFEKANVVYFTFLGFLSIFLYGSTIQYYGVQINYISIAIIWGISVLLRALTIDYSKYNHPPSIADTKIFKETNNILTLFWTVLFLIMGGLTTLLEIYGLLAFSPAIYVLVILGLLFTGHFSEKYPEYVAKGRKKDVLIPF